MMLDCLALLDLKDNKLIGELFEPACVTLWFGRACSKLVFKGVHSAFVQRDNAREHPLF